MSGPCVCPVRFAGLATVALTYALGVRIGGRAVGLASAMMLCTSWLFIAEARQAGNDAPLGLYCTLALYAAWRRLHGGTPGARRSAGEPGEVSPGSRRWTLLFHGAIGLGFLCKGPIIVLIVGMTVVPYLAMTGRLRSGLPLLASTPGLALSLALSLCWPVPVLLTDPHAQGVWTTEIGQKTGILAIPHQGRADPRPGAPLAGPSLARGGAGRPDPAPDRPGPRDQAAMEGLLDLVPVVVVGGEPGGLQFLGRGQTQLLRALSAWPGLADGHGLDPPEPCRP